MAPAVWGFSRLKIRAQMTRFVANSRLSLISYKAYYYVRYRDDLDIVIDLPVCDPVVEASSSEVWIDSATQFEVKTQFPS